MYIPNTTMSNFFANSWVDSHIVIAYVEHLTRTFPLVRALE